MSIVCEESISKSAVVHVEDGEGVKVAVARVSFSFCPLQSASFTVQVLNKNAAAKHLEEVARKVTEYAAQVIPEAYRSQVPIGWPAQPD